MNRTIPLILAVALFMENMDSTVIATSLPAIAIDIDTSPIALKLALTAYLVSLAIFIPDQRLDGRPLRRQERLSRGDRRIHRRFGRLRLFRIRCQLSWFLASCRALAAR